MALFGGWGFLKPTGSQFHRSIVQPIPYEQPLGEKSTPLLTQSANEGQRVFMLKPLRQSFVVLENRTHLFSFKNGKAL